jgi:dTDP-D-glucose 4,6-dehydratase
VDLEEGLQRTIEWYKSNVKWFRKLKQNSKEYYEKQYGKDF